MWRSTETMCLRSCRSTWRLTVIRQSQLLWPSVSGLKLFRPTVRLRRHPCCPFWSMSSAAVKLWSGEVSIFFQSSHISLLIYLTLYLPYNKINLFSKCYFFVEWTIFDSFFSMFSLFSVCLWSVRDLEGNRGMSWLNECSGPQWPEEAVLQSSSATSVMHKEENTGFRGSVDFNQHSVSSVPMLNKYNKMKSVNIHRALWGKPSF